MNRGLWISRKNYLLTLIKKVSIGFGGDDIKFLNEYCHDILQKYTDEQIEQVIECYRLLEGQIKYRK